MKKSFVLFFFIPLILSCRHNNIKVRSEESIRKEITDSTISYARSKFKSSKVTVAAGGIVIVADNEVNFVAASSPQAKYVIDPAKIVTGMIDADNNEDAIISVISIDAKNMEAPENLIFINTDGKFMLNRVIESNMRVLGIKNRIITAEVSTRSLNSPLRDCHICKEVVKYQYRTGDLVRIE